MGIGDNSLFINLWCAEMERYLPEVLFREVASYLTIDERLRAGIPPTPIKKGDALKTAHIWQPAQQLSDTVWFNEIAWYLGQENWFKDIAWYHGHRLIITNSKNLSSRGDMKITKWENPTQYEWTEIKLTGKGEGIVWAQYVKGLIY